MPRYFFHIRTSATVIKDRKGIDLPEMTDVKSELLRAAREVLQEAEWQPELAEGGEFEIVDENGQIVATVRFDNLGFDQ